MGAEREEIILLASFFWPSSVHRDPLLAGVPWDAGTSHIRVPGRDEVTASSL